KREDRASCALESLPQHTRIDIKRFGGFRPWKIENLTQDVGETVRPVKALEHRQRAADLDFLNEHRQLVLAGAIGSESLRQVFGQAHEIQIHALDGAPLPVQKVVDRDAVGPRFQAAAEIEARELSDDSHEDLLGRVFRILAVPQHSESHGIDVGLNCSHERVQRIAVSSDCASRNLLDSCYVAHCASRSRLSSASSSRNVIRWASIAPSNCTKGTVEA